MQEVGIGRKKQGKIDFSSTKSLRNMNTIPHEVATNVYNIEPLSKAKEYFKVARGSAPNTISVYGERPLWKEAARSGAKLNKERCIGKDGRMFFLATREGEPLRKRRYFIAFETIRDYCFSLLVTRSMADGIATSIAMGSSPIPRRDPYGKGPILFQDAL